MRTYPPGSRFLPTELGLVKLHLKNKVEKNISGFIKTLNVYVDAPWRLDHDTNHLYPRNEWYYFVPRTIRGKKTVSRIVPSNGESLGGTWKSIGKKQEVKNRQVLMGYKNELVFNKNVVVDGKSKQEKTDWHMDEYSLNREGEEFLDLILCHIRLLHSAERFKPVVPPAHHQVVEYNDNNNNVVLQNQDQQQVAVGFANHNNDHMMMMVETNQRRHYPLEDIAYHGAEDDMTSGYDGLVQSFNQGNNVNQQEAVGFANHNDMMMMVETNQQQQEQQEQQDSLNLPHPPMQTNNNIEQQCTFAEDDMSTGYGGLMEIFNQGNNVNQQQHEQQQDSQALHVPPLQSNDNLEQQCTFAYHGAEDDMTSGYGGLMEIFNQGNNVNQQQQEDSQALTLQTNVNQEHFPSEDYAFDGADDNLTIGLDVIMKVLNEGKEQEDSPAPLQSNDNHGLCPHVPSQVENHNNSNTLLPNQDQQEEAGLANQHPPLQSNDNQEHYPKPLEDIAFDEMLDELRREQEDSPTNLLPPLQSNDNHGLCPLVPSQVLENHNNNNNNVLPNQEHGEHGDVEQEHYLDQSLTPEQLRNLEIYIDTLNLSF